MSRSRNSTKLAFGLILGLCSIATAQQESWSVSVESTDEVRSLVAELMSDAETRTSLLQSGGAGHDGKFFLSSPDGDFRLNVGGQVQFRYTANLQDEDDTVNNDSFEGGFSTPRTALEFSGNIYGDSLLYRISGNFDSDGGSFDLEDAYGGYAFENGLVVIWGQLRMPVLWEDLIREKYSLAVDQSVVNAVFRQDRSQGVWLHYQAEDWRMWIGFDDGIRSENTDIGADPADWAFTTRWEWKFAGAWSQFDQFSSAPGSDFAGKLAGAIHWQDGPNGGTGPAELELGAYTFDLMLEGDGWNAFAAFVGLYTEPAGGESNSDFGLLAQGGVFIPDTDWEIFGRYDVVLPDTDRTGDDAFNTLTAGLNYYMHGQAAKFTIDVQWYLDATTGNDLVSGIATGQSGSVGNSIGLLPSDNDNQFAVRAQFQLLF